MKVSDYARNYLRSRSTELMEDTCRIYRPSSNRVSYNPVTRQAINTTGTDIYRGVCRVWEVPAGGKFVLGEVEYTTTQLWLSLPYDSPVPEPDDQVEILASDDVSLIGRHLKVLSVVRGGGLRGSRKMQVEFVDKKS